MASSATMAPLNNHHTRPSMFGGIGLPLLHGFFNWLSRWSRSHGVPLLKS
jgi:hypothetical protein